MKIVLVFLLIILTTAAHAEPVQIDDPITVNINATLDNTARIEAQIVQDQIELMIEGEPQTYTVIEEIDGTKTLLFTGE